MINLKTQTAICFFKELSLWMGLISEGTHDVERIQCWLCSQDPLSFLISILSVSSSTISSLLQRSCGVCYDHDETPNMLSVILIVLGQ